MGWSFEKADWSAVEGAYYAAIGSEWVWLGISVACCVVALVVGSKHELDAYRREEDRAKR